MMSLKGQSELLYVVPPRYLRVKRERILDEFISATGSPRKYTIHVLKRTVPRRKKKKRTGYLTLYRREVVEALEEI
jgi:hypothetical protein